MNAYIDVRHFVRGGLLTTERSQSAGMAPTCRTFGATSTLTLRTTSRWRSVPTTPTLCVHLDGFLPAFEH